MLARRYEFAALLVYMFVLVIHAPWIFFLGRFWAEEATVYLAYAWSHPLPDALLAPHLGYYNLVANLGGILAAHVPLESAPRYMTALALLVQSVPAAVVLFTPIPGLDTPLRKLAALLLLLVVPTNPEIYLNTINCHFVLCAATGLVLVAAHGGRADRAAKWLLLGLAGLTGVVATFLTPFFWLQWWLERRRERLEQAAILTACALVQLVFISRGVAHEERHVRFNATIMTGAAYAKFIAMPLAPAKPADAHLHRIQTALQATGFLPGWLRLVTGASFAAFVVLCWRSGSRTAWLLGAAAVWVAVLSFIGSREAVSDQKLLVHLSGAFRYYYAPQFFFFLALLAGLAPATKLPRALQAVGAAWLSVALLIGLVNFARAPLDWPIIFSGPPWGPQVEQWRNDPSRPLAVWPMGWQVTLPAKP